jgi:AcrR family transcriptional regulator
VGTVANAVEGEDQLRTQLLDAAARVFARQGYAGTKIMDIVREAGLSTGAVYGRFRSKNDLLREAVTRSYGHAANAAPAGVSRVADLVAWGMQQTVGSLTDVEAVRLEAMVTARREPEVAQAVGESDAQWRAAVEPLVAAAMVDGTLDEGVDPEAVLFFVRTMYLGLLLQRGSGLDGPEPEAWKALVTRLVSSFGATGPGNRWVEDQCPSHTKVKKGR